MRIIMLANIITQNASPKNAVHTKTDGFMNGHNAHKNAANKAAIPQMPIIAFPNPCKNVFLLASFSITSCFV